MVANRTAMREGDRQARAQAHRLGIELAALRLRAGISQAAVGRALAIDRTVISRLERGDPQVSLPIRFRAAALLGAELRVSAYAQSGPLIRDAAQAAIGESILAMTDRRWRRTVEASVPGNARMSVDLRLDQPGRTVLIEVESRVGSLEEIIRELHVKRDAFASGALADRTIHVVLALPATRHHREIVAKHPETIASAFPVASALIEAALKEVDLVWPGDGILWIPAARASRTSGSATRP